MKKILLIFAGMLCFAHFAYANVYLRFWDIGGCFSLNGAWHISNESGDDAWEYAMDTANELFYDLTRHELGWQTGGFLDTRGESFYDDNYNEDTLGGIFISGEGGSENMTTINIVLPPNAMYGIGSHSDSGLSLQGDCVGPACGDVGTTRPSNYLNGTNGRWYQAEPVGNVYCNSGHWSPSQRSCVSCNDSNCWRCSGNNNCTVCRTGMKPDANGQCKYYFKYYMWDSAGQFEGSPFGDTYSTTRSYQFAQQKTTALSNAGYSSSCSRSYRSSSYQRRLSEWDPVFTVMCSIQEYFTEARCNQHKPANKYCVPSGRSFEGYSTYIRSDTPPACPANMERRNGAGECMYRTTIVFRDRAAYDSGSTTIVDNPEEAPYNGLIRSYHQDYDVYGEKWFSTWEAALSWAASEGDAIDAAVRAAGGGTWTPTTGGHGDGIATNYLLFMVGDDSQFLGQTRCNAYINSQQHPLSYACYQEPNTYINSAPIYNFRQGYVSSCPAGFSKSSDSCCCLKD